jgi:hypothetical protein
MPRCFGTNTGFRRIAETSVGTYLGLLPQQVSQIHFFRRAQWDLTETRVESARDGFFETP